MADPLVLTDFLLEGAGADSGGVTFHALGFYGEGFEGHPYQPTLDSGVTLGYGYDLSAHNVSQLYADWTIVLSTQGCNRLAMCVGYRGSQAKAFVATVRDLRWTKDEARLVFESSTIPRYAKLVDEWAPGWRALPIGTRTALLSLAINRGTARRQAGLDPFEASRRDEFDLIPKYVAVGDLPQIAALFRSQMHLWLDNAATDDDALARRRECEARLIETDYPSGNRAA